MSTRTSLRLIRPIVALAVLVAVLPGGLAQAEPPTSVAVFGNNQIDNYLTGAGFSATVVDNEDLETEGFLNGFDVFFYTRDGDATPGASLSAGAAANVSAFVDDGR